MQSTNRLPHLDAAAIWFRWDSARPTLSSQTLNKKLRRRNPTLMKAPPPHPSPTSRHFGTALATSSFPTLILDPKAGFHSVFDFPFARTHAWSL